MKSSLQNWGERMLGNTPKLSPRIASRFESQSVSQTEGDSAGFQEIHETIVSQSSNAQNPVPPRERGDTTPQTVPNNPTTQDQNSITTTPVEHYHDTDQPTIETPPTSEIITPQPVITPPVVSHQSSVAEEPPSISSRASEHTKPNQPSTTERIVIKETQKESDEKPRRSLDQELRRLQDWMSRPAEETASEKTAQPKVEPQIPTALTRAVPPQPIQQVIHRQAPVAPPPTPAPVEVNIGTIIVKAQAPTTPTPQPTSHAADRISSLNNFLARRTAGES